MAFFMAYGIGANDVANAFATSVGSKTLTLFQATCIAAVMEFAGALLLGRGVTKTVRKGIIDPDYFTEAPEVLMYGMLCALAAAGTWLMIATYLECPVSTTHSIIGCAPRALLLALCLRTRVPRVASSGAGVQGPHRLWPCCAWQRLRHLVQVG